MSVQVQNYITSLIRGKSAVEIAGSIETAIRDQRLAPEDPLPPIRSAASALSVSPATVAAAYRQLRERGLLVTRGRHGTAVSPRPPLPARQPPPLPEHVLDLSNGNPDPRLLPPLAGALRSLDPGHHLYGEEICHGPLLEAAARQFAADGIPADQLTVVSGALDGIERVLNVHLRPGDRVAVEDPGFTSVLDLLPALGLTAVPVAVDDSGPRPDALEDALERGVSAFVLTPRAQNPSGAALDAPRARSLRRVLRAHPDLLVVEDDHAGPVAGTPAFTLCDARRARWAVVRSVSKSLGPDLRVAVLSGDATTVGRVEGRTLITMRWVSHLLQRLVVALWSQPGARRRVEKAAHAYSERRAALVDALAARGIEAHGRSGLNVWIPVPAESDVLARLLEAGYAASPGRRFRIECGPAIRVCVASLPRSRARPLADAIATALAPTHRTFPA